MRRATETHPVAVVLGVTAGAVLAGIFGAIIAVPVVAVIGRVINAFREEQADAPPARFVVTQPGEVAAVAAETSRSTSD
jgi:putative heme transporter